MLQRCEQRELQLLRTIHVGSRSRSVTCDSRFTGGRFLQLNKNHNSITIENNTRTDINFFLSKRLRKSSTAVMSTSRESPSINLAVEKLR